MSPRASGLRGLALIAGGGVPLVGSRAGPEAEDRGFLILSPPTGATGRDRPPGGPSGYLGLWPRSLIVEAVAPSPWHRRMARRHRPPHTLATALPGAPPGASRTGDLTASLITVA